MRNKAYDLSSYSFSTGEQVLVDTNIWLYLFPAPSDPLNAFATQYSTAFAYLVNAKAIPILDPIILSEYLNRYCRIEWNANYNHQYKRFKDFRNSQDFSAAATSAETYARRILSYCKIHSIPTNEIDLEEALNNFHSGTVDFNDAIIIDICKRRSLKLMTNDSDFKNGGIEILTTNPRLLRACP